MKLYKTIKNLEIIWEQLDEACGSLDNATMNIASMNNLSPEAKELAERIDISPIVVLKNEIESLIEEKKKLHLYLKIDETAEGDTEDE